MEEADFLPNSPPADKELMLVMMMMMMMRFKRSQSSKCCAWWISIHFVYFYCETSLSDH